MQRGGRHGFGVPAVVRVVLMGLWVVGIAAGVGLVPVRSANAQQAPVIIVAKDAIPSVIDAGGIIFWRITVGNVGNADAHTVTLTDTLPTLPSGASWIVPAGCSLIATTMTCDLGTLVAGATLFSDVLAITTAADCGFYENTAVVTWAETSEGGLVPLEA